MIFSSGAFAVIVEEPIWGANAGIIVHDDIVAQISSYTHEKSADMGYKSASFNLNATQADARDWLQNAVGRHVVCREGEIFWEGFVNSVDVTIGEETRSNGPLVNVVTRLAAEYAAKTFDVGGGITLPGGVTDFADDTAAQNKYGILEAIINVGEVSPDEAEVIRDTLLAYGVASIDTTGSLSFGGNAPTVSVSCLGYSSFLSKYIYNYDSGSATVMLDADEKIKAILTADPGSRFSSDYQYIESNASVQSPDYEFENKEALTLIKDIVAQGDATDTRWLFGVTANRKAYYRPVPTDVMYHRDLETDTVFKYGDRTVLPWHVEAGENILSQFVVPTKLGAEIDSDSVRFIERVSYSAPSGLSITTGRITRVAQILARLGLGSL